MAKPISHWQRRNNKEFSPAPVVVSKNLERRMSITNEYDEKSNRVIRKSELKTIDRKKEMENYTCADFSLENMLASGVNIQHVHLDASGFRMLDNLEAQVEKMSNSLKNDK